MTAHKVMLVFGTRPEAVKMAPLVRELSRFADEIDTSVVVTAQHREMLDQVLEAFDIVPDHDLDLMRAGQTPAAVAARVLDELDPLLRDQRPDMVLVQGDTTTAFAAGLAAFFNRVKVGHVEAGLRTHDLYNPFPEELHRQCIDLFADLCFAPTPASGRALLDEGLPPERVHVTGNTVIDALLDVVGRPHRFTSPRLEDLVDEKGYTTMLVATHRRESFGDPLENVCAGIRDLLDRYPKLRVVLPVHPNPAVSDVVRRTLDDHERVLLTDPLDYLDFVHLMKAVDLVLTDSGGVQEEAPALGKPVLVIRDTTERPEAVDAGTARLIGTSRAAVISEVSRLLDDPAEYALMACGVSPYGDGHAAERTVAVIRHRLGLTDALPESFGPAAA